MLGLLYQYKTGEVVTMATKLHKPLLLLLFCLFVANLPSCSSQLVFERPRLFPVLRQVRREAVSGERESSWEEHGAWKKMDVDEQLVKDVAESAAQQANVTSTNIMQAFFNVCIHNTMRQSLAPPLYGHCDF